jgi:hypothetical protein
MTVTSLRTKARKAKALPFDPVKYAWNVAHSRVRKADRPVTLADHEAAEREARKTLDERLEGRNKNFETVPEISELEGDYLEGEYAAEMAAGRMSLDAADEEVSDIRDWARDIIDEVEGWQTIATDLLMLKAKLAGKKKAA